MKFIKFTAVTFLSLCVSLSHAQADKVRGGGNGVKGVPLENFAKDIGELPEFKQYIEPILQRLDQIFPTLAEDLRQVYFEKRFYFVPEDLDELSSADIGVAFRTDQLALHGFYSVWIDSVSYEQSRFKPRATLLLHELVMGILLGSKSEFWSCWFLEGDVCSAISARTHDKVRNLTVALMDNLDQYTTDDLLNLLISLDFPYRDPVEAVVPQDSILREPPSPYEFIRILESEGIQSRIPIQATDGRGCVVEVVTSGQLPVVKLFSRTQSGLAKRSEQPFEVRLSSAPQIIDDGPHLIYRFYDPYSPSHFRKVLDFKINQSRVLRVEAWWEQLLLDFGTRKIKWKKSPRPKGTIQPESKTCF